MTPLFLLVVQHSLHAAGKELLPQYKDPEDLDFAVRLFRTSILNAEQYQRYMTATSKNWDFSRLAYMDVVIMQIAIAEMLSFPAIPVTVTINEYLTLAKNYSTPKSARYVNGMLDAIARYLSETAAGENRETLTRGGHSEHNTQIYN